MRLAVRGSTPIDIHFASLSLTLSDIAVSSIAIIENPWSWADYILPEVSGIFLLRLAPCVS